MGINKKRIVKELLYEKATSHGFSVILGTRGSSRYDIATLKRDGEGQLVELYEYAFLPGEIYLDGISNEPKKFSYKENDENSFRSSIKEVSNLLDSEGYSILDERLNQPTISYAENHLVEEHYSELAQKFCEKNCVNLNTISFEEAKKIIVEALDQIKGFEWDSVKDDFCEIVSFYLVVLLKLPNIELTHSEYDDELMVRRTFDQFKSLVILQNAFDAWRPGDTNEMITWGFEDVLTEEECEKYGIN